MRVAVIGAGIVGVTTAYELAVDGHDVTVFERQASVAAETSFANAGVLAPGYVKPWAAPGMPGKVLRQMFGRHAAVRLARPFSPALLGWTLRWWRSCRPSVHQANRARMILLARFSLLRMHMLSASLQLEFEQGKGLLVLLRTPRDLARARSGVKLLAELGVNCHVIDAAKARKIEPGLNVDTPLHAALHLPDEEVGNCRQFAHLMKQHAQQRGAMFRFHRDVQRIEAGTQPTVYHRALPRFDPQQLAGAEQPTTLPESEGSEQFDAVVVCAAMASRELLAPLKPLPLAPGTATGDRAAARSRRAWRSVALDADRRAPRSPSAACAWPVACRVGRHAANHQRRCPGHVVNKVLDDWFPALRCTPRRRAGKARDRCCPRPASDRASGMPGVGSTLGHPVAGRACGSARVRLM
jgi:D-amino-acid dehydrogenase